MALSVASQVKDELTLNITENWARESEAARVAIRYVLVKGAGWLALDRNTSNNAN